MPSELIPLNSLPTPLASVAHRLNVVGRGSSADTFLTASYLFEATLKFLVVALYAGLRSRHHEHAYKTAFTLVRADGLGNWDQAFRELTSAPVSAFVPPEMSPLLAWAAKKRTKADDGWAKAAHAAALRILSQLGTDAESPQKLTVTHIISAAVQIRNKTKAHGAVGEDFYNAANDDYVDLVRAMLDNCPAMQWTWVRAYRTPANIVRAIRLAGSAPNFDDDAGRILQSLNQEGVFCLPERATTPFFCGPLLQADRQCKNFFLPNGGVSGTKAEFLDYGSGVTKPFDVSQFLTPPAPLPPSETHADFRFDVQSNVFGNLPVRPERYVERPHLQSQLLMRIKDSNHAIITLHGRGGVGKTYLALYGAHSMAESPESPFEYIVWLSARDIDLRTRGTAPVRRDVGTLDEICRGVGTLFGFDGNLVSFSSLLQNPRSSAPPGKGILFVLDNFETLTDVREVHSFLDEHTHLPNKVLITSRERAFKADYPIEVRGMEFDEAKAMLVDTARELDIQHLMDDERISELYRYTDGHAYAMRVLAGEMAKEGRKVPIKNIMPRRLDVVQAVFERSFNKLTDAGRRVFLVVAGFRSVISELALLVVIGQRQLDVELGIDECARLSLIEQLELADSTSAYVAPQLARIFAQKKLDGDPDRLLIQEDLETAAGG